MLFYLDSDTAVLGLLGDGNVGALLALPLAGRVTSENLTAKQLLASVHPLLRKVRHGFEFKNKSVKRTGERQLRRLRGRERVETDDDVQEMQTKDTALCTPHTHTQKKKKTEERCVEKWTTFSTTFPPARSLAQNGNAT